MAWMETVSIKQGKKKNKKINIKLKKDRKKEGINLK